MASLDELMEKLRVETGGGYSWSNGPHDRYAAHSHGYDKVLYCVEGSITFELDEGRKVVLRAGDRLDLPAGAVHSATVGDRGCVCVEGHKAMPSSRA